MKRTRKTKKKHQTTDLLSFWKFRYLILGLVAVFIYVHGIDVEINFGESNAVEQPQHAGLSMQSARPQLASFKHANNLSKNEIATLRKAYIERYADIAINEMKAHGIPASITLAQGLLESVAGTSKLATTTNNHFGIKCFSKACKPDHCLNFDDDHHKDFFRKYPSAHESYAAHSKFIKNGTRYKSLFSLKPDDYKGWAKGLSKAGYATDPRYANKLISLIERYDLHKYDR